MLENRTEEGQQAQAGREQRVADSRVVLMMRGLRNLVTVWRRKPRGPKEGKRTKQSRTENPPLMTVNNTSESAAAYVGTTSNGQLEGIVAPSSGKTRTRDEDGDTGESH